MDKLFSDKNHLIPDRERKCLTKDQAKHIYEMVEMNKPLDIHIMKQDIKDNSKTRDKLKEEETESDLYPYQMAILNK